MRIVNNIGEISIGQDRIDWKITQFSSWPNFNKDTTIRSPLFSFAGEERHFSAYLKLEEGYVILFGMFMTICSRDTQDFESLLFGIIEDANDEFIMSTHLNCHGGFAYGYKPKYKKKQVIKNGGNLHLFCYWNSVEPIADKLSDDHFAVPQMKDEKTTYKDIATQKDMESAVLQMKDEKTTYKDVATQDDMERAAFPMKDEKTTSKEMASQEDMKNDIGHLCQNLKNLLLNGEDHDLILKVSNKEFRAHQCILRVRSPVLDSMLSHDMIEKKSGIIDIPDCDPGAFEQFLLYLYSGEVERLNEGNMLALYYIADKYDMGHLKKQCCEFVKNSLTSSNVSEVVELALVHSDAVLLAPATQYFLKNASEVLRTVEWQSFAGRNIIQANELCIKAFDSLKAEKV